MTDNNKGCLGTPVVVYKHWDSINVLGAVGTFLFAVIFAWMAFDDFKSAQKAVYESAYVSAVFSVLLASLAIYMFFRSKRILCFSSAGIALYAGHRLLHNMPVGEIEFILSGTMMQGRSPVPCVAVSEIALEEVAQRQEKKLLKNWVSKHDVPFLKRNPNWQRMFAEEYIRKLVFWHPLGTVKNGILLLRSTPRLQAILDEQFPQVQRIKYKSIYSQAEY